MKRNALLSSVLVLCLGFLVSCAKPADTPGSTGVTIQSSMSATINGASWVATNFSGTILSGTLQIEGAKSDGTQFTFSIPESTGSGTFTIGGQSNYQAQYASGNTYSVMAGTIKISSNSSNVISGTFSGTLTNASTQATSTVTGGVFTSTYK